MDYKQFLEHTCRLDMRQDIVDMLTPPGFMYSFRVWLRRWTMSSRTDQRSKMFLKSNYSVRLDRKKHYNLYFYSVHPLSDAMSLWERIYIIMFLLSVLLFPFTVSLDFKLAIYANFVLDLLFLLNMFLTFFGGYINESRKAIVLDRRLITKHYLLTFFIIDLITSIPMNFIVYLLNSHELITPSLRGLRIIRMHTVVKLLKIQHLRHGYAEIINKFAIIIMLYVMGIWCSASVIVVRTAAMQREYDNQQGVSNLFLKALHKITKIIMLSHIDREHDIELAFSYPMIVIFLSLGFFVELIVVTHFLMIISGFKGTEFKFKTLKEEVSDYCAAKQLPTQMHERLDTYYNFRYQQHFYNEVDMDYVLTDHLKQEVQVARMRRFIEAVDIFSQLPVNVLIEITLAFKVEYFLRTDLLVQHNTACDCLYVIAIGTVAIYDNTKKEVCHLEDGCYIGEMSLLFNVEHNIPTTVALSSCEVFVLEKKSFELIMKKHKVHLDNMYLLAQDKLQETLYVMQLQGYDFIPPQVVVKECLEKRK